MKKIKKLREKYHQTKENTDATKLKKRKGKDTIGGNDSGGKK